MEPKTRPQSNAEQFETLAAEYLSCLTEISLAEERVIKAREYLDKESRTLKIIRERASQIAEKLQPLLAANLQLSRHKER